MKIIPVIDIKDGAVVHAREGRRDQYLPLKTSLCPSADILQIIQAFVTIYHFDTVYIADLNAITLQGNHDDLINDVLAYFPDLMFWIDSGYQHPGKRLRQPGNYLPVLGSESYRDEAVLELKTFTTNFILSLDFSLSEPLGALSLFSSPEFWPDNIIIMTLDRVGSNQGPDLVKLSQFCNQYPHKNFIAAGGIRNQQDLIALKEIGMQKALIASALHSGAVKPEDIKNL